MRAIKWLWRGLVSGLRQSRLASTKQPTEGALGGVHGYKRKD